ncbi:calcium-binding protein [Microvirga sp. VF16]|uniref:calcium-binding protein n=1 Tax=Microvirga sp. VF16 TaxID=2807101 RepID=UPI00193DE200|nr:hypothetical protein [Microvirga sp. VF16]QRM29449.1 hypothetical protein JO965_25360 [Microvirga sp. VF16]
MAFGGRFTPGQDTQSQAPDLLGGSNDGGGAAEPYSPGEDTQSQTPDMPGGSDDGGAAGAVTPVPDDLDEQLPGSGNYYELGDQVTGETWLWTGPDRDVIVAGDGTQRIWSGEGPDDVSGGNGHDMLFGEGGNDRLYGEDGFDFIMGGLGSDRLSGGAQDDRFYYSDPAHESPATSTGADTIVDFSLEDEDIIDLPVRGTAENYGSAGTNATSMDEAAQEANQTYGDDGLTYVYLANEETDTGYLLANLDENDGFETGITLAGNGGPGEFSYEAIGSP